MKRFRLICFACAAFAIASFTGAQPARAQSAPAATDPTVIAPIDTFIAAILSNSPEKMPGAFASSSTILDDLPPDSFTGPTAYKDWYAAFVASNAAAKIKVQSLAHGTPHYVHVTGDRAYVVVPSDFTYTIDGKVFAESAAWTFALVKEAGAWKIGSWSWSLLTDTAE